MTTGTHSTQDLAITWADYASRVTYDDLPDNVRRILRWLVLDTLSTTLAANTLGVGIPQLLTWARGAGGTPEATLIGFGDRLPAGDTIGVIQRPGGEEAPVLAPFTGVVRGLIHESTPVNAGMKIGDMDPRVLAEHAFTISDKSLTIGGGVLEAILVWMRGKDSNADSIDVI